MLTQGSLRPIYICGSTATGKTGVSIALANQLNAEIVNADAYQVYRGLDTITAAPSTEELAQAPHHLFGILDPIQEFDSQQYINLARPTIAAIQQRGKIPIVVGGSGMYLKFLTHGPSPVPPGDPQLRQQLEQESNQHLVERLQQLDPIGAAETNLKNRRYVIRALEICILSGQKMSELKNDWKMSSKNTEKHLRGFLLDWDRDTLRQRIKLRTSHILDHGAIQEVAQQQHLSTTCAKAIGIKEIRAHLKGEISLHRCEELIYFATSQYAKRQRSWFKREQWITPIAMDNNSNQQEIVKKIITPRSQ